MASSPASRASKRASARLLCASTSSSLCTFVLGLTSTTRPPSRRILVCNASSARRLVSARIDVRTSSKLESVSRARRAIASSVTRTAVDALSARSSRASSDTTRSSSSSSASSSSSSSSSSSARFRRLDDVGALDADAIERPRHARLPASRRARRALHRHHEARPTSGKRKTNNGKRL